MKSQSSRRPRYTRSIYIPRLEEATGMETRRRKQRRLELSGSASPTASIASSMILIYLHTNNNKYLYSVYSLKTSAAENMNTDTVPPIPAPIFRFPCQNCPENMGFATLGSKIYFIGGQKTTHSPSSWPVDFPLLWKTDSPSSSESETDSPAYPDPFSFSLNTYVLDTAKPLPPRLAFHDPESFLIRGPNLNAPKLNPISIVFEGKIFLFPRDFSPHSPRFFPCEVLVDGKFVTLPDPPFLDKGCPTPSRQSSVESYLVSDSNFVACTRRGIFSLNLKNPARWDLFQKLGCVNHFPFHGEGIRIKDDLYAIASGELVTFDFNGRLAMAEKEHSFDLSRGDGSIKCLRGNDLVHLGQNRLCVIRYGQDIEPPMIRHTNQYSTLVGCEIFEAVQKKQEKKHEEKNLYGLVRLCDSEFIMEDRGIFVGCFPLMDEAN